MCQYLEGELNVDLATLKEFEDMVHKDFAGPGHIPFIFLCQRRSPPHHLPSYHLPPPPVASLVTVQRAMVLSTQCTVHAFTALIQLPPRDSLALIIYIVTCLICVTPHLSQHQGSFCQDRVGSTSPGYSKLSKHVHEPPTKSKMFALRLPSGMVILYIYTSHLSVTSRAGFLLDERS